MSNLAKNILTFDPNELLLSPKEYFAEMVQSGFSKRNIKKNPAVEVYLVDLLAHYLDARNLFDEPTKENGEKNPSTLAEMFLTASNSDHLEKIGLLKKLGDRTLYISGFFGDSLSRKVVDIDYYVEMGGAAYGSLADCVREDDLAYVYNTFSTRFVEFVDVLTYISQQSFVQNDESILRLYERYIKTGSEVARQKLIEMGVMIVSPDQVRSSKQDWIRKEKWLCKALRV